MELDSLILIIVALVMNFVFGLIIIYSCSKNLPRKKVILLASLLAVGGLLPEVLLRNVHF